MERPWMVGGVEDPLPWDFDWIAGEVLRLLELSQLVRTEMVMVFWAQKMMAIPPLKQIPLMLLVKIPQLAIFPQSSSLLWPYLLRKTTSSLGKLPIGAGLSCAGLEFSAV